MKFGCCDTCVNYDTGACNECEDAEHYEFDETLIELGADGFMQVRKALVAA